MIQGDWIQDAIRVPSPNCDERPAGVEVSLLVVHGISLPPGEFGGPWIDQLFTNRLDSDAHPYFQEVAEFRVSSHILIRRDGAMVQYVPFSRRAWHAGPSCFEGTEACNDFSIGVELEGDDRVPYTDAQYEQLARIVRALQGVFPAIKPDRIVGHCDIAPERKTDPGPAFDWERLRQLMAS